MPKPHLVIPRRVAGAPQWIRVVRERSIYDAEHADSVSLTAPEDVARYLEQRLASEEQEVFVALLLDAQHKLIASCEVTRGLVNSSLVHPREVFRIAIVMNASRIVLAHNHPSGDTTPSPDDIQVTRDLVAAGHVVGIPVKDHCIIAAGKIFSFAYAGLL